MADSFVNRKNAPIKIDPSFEKSGGEGVVWGVGNPKSDYPFRVLAKIYHKAPQGDQKEKIKTMLALPAKQRNELLGIAAWPIDAVFDANGKALRGFVMPMAGDHIDIHKLYNPKDRRKYFPQADWSFLGFTAMNVARAFSHVHQHGHVAGDINHSNILIGSDAKAILIDTDSFQIRAPGKSFKCTVGVPEFLPPELFNKDLKSVVRTANHDNFSIAVMMFLLLCNGWHPFSGQDTGSKTLSLNEAVEKCLFAFGKGAKRAGILPPPNARTIHPSDLPQEIADLFERAFSTQGMTGGRPTAAEWASTIQHSLLGNLEKCKKGAQHHRVSGKACPWCRLEKIRANPVFGRSKQRQRPANTARRPNPVTKQRASANPGRPIRGTQNRATARRQARGASMLAEGKWFRFGGTIGRLSFLKRLITVVVGALAIVIIAEETREEGFLFLLVFTSWLSFSSVAQRLRSFHWSPWLCLSMPVPYLNLAMVGLLLLKPRKY